MTTKSSSDFLTKLPDGDQVVGICVHCESVLVATTLGVYVLHGDVLVPLRFQIAQNEVVNE